MYKLFKGDSVHGLKSCLSVEFNFKEIIYSKNSTLLQSFYMRSIKYNDTKL